MAYLVKNDYTLHISLDHLDEILQEASESSSLSTAAILTEAEATSQAEIEAYLSKHYDTATEFAIDGAAAPATRNRLVKKCMIDITIYHILFTINPRDIPESREKLYNDCIEMLKAYRNGELDWGLNIVDADGDGQADVNRLSMGSHRKFISRPFTDPILTDQFDLDNDTP